MCCRPFLTGIVGWFIVHTFRTFAGVTYLPLEFMTKILIIVIVGGRAFSLRGHSRGAYLISAIEDALRGLGPINYFVFPPWSSLRLLFSSPGGKVCGDCITSGAPGIISRNCM